MRMIRLLVADDHAIVREGLKQIFALTDDIEVAAEAASAVQLLELLRRDGFDVLLLDMTMPGLNGVDLVMHVRARHPRLPILVLSMHTSPNVVKRALKAGASGYLAKETVPEILIAAIRKTAAGGRFIDPVLAEQIVFAEEGNNPDLPHKQLTEREFQVLCLLIRGKSIGEISEQLAISVKTVSTHKAHLMQKMECKTQAELVSYGLAHGLLEHEPGQQ